MCLSRLILSVIPSKICAVAKWLTGRGVIGVGVPQAMVTAWAGEGGYAEVPGCEAKRDQLRVALEWVHMNRQYLPGLPAWAGNGIHALGDLTIPSVHGLNSGGALLAAVLQALLHMSVRDDTAVIAGLDEKGQVLYGYDHFEYARGLGPVSKKLVHNLLKRVVVPAGMAGMWATMLREEGSEVEIVPVRNVHELVQTVLPEALQLPVLLELTDVTADVLSKVGRCHWAHASGAAPRA
jgi:hypothetical protein